MEAESRFFDFVNGRSAQTSVAKPERPLQVRFESILVPMIPGSIAAHPWVRANCCNQAFTPTIAQNAIVGAIAIFQQQQCWFTVAEGIACWQTWPPLFFLVTVLPLLILNQSWRLTSVFSSN